MSEPAAYPYFEDVNRGILRQWAGRRGFEVLDVGCGFAATSEEIQRLGNAVTGIEASPEACEVAKERLTRVVREDLRNLEGVRAQLGRARFDAILFADVLEHLAAPLDVLRSYLDFLTPAGSVIVSIPNVGLWSVRLGLLVGRWEYADTGVLDRTHLRFFTRTSAKQMLAEAGLTVVGSTVNPGLVRPFLPVIKRWIAPSRPGVAHDPSAILQSAPYRAYLRAIHPVERLVASLWPGMLAFQMIYEAKRPR